MFCSIMVLPVRGGATISARCPLPSGATMSRMRLVVSFRAWIGDFHAEALLGVERRQIVEIDLVTEVLRRVEIECC